MDDDTLPWSTFLNRCRAVREKTDGDPFWGRCELKKHNHSIDHALERGMIIPRWSTKWTIWTNPRPESKWIQDACECSEPINGMHATHEIICPYYKQTQGLFNDL